MEKEVLIGTLPNASIYEDEIKKLRQFNEDLRWFQDNYRDLKKMFKGEYVAVVHSKVIDHDKDLHQVLKRLRERKGLDTSSMVIEFVNPEHKVFVL
jgi:hypothetical protein